MIKEYMIISAETGKSVKEIATLKGINRKALKDIKMKGQILLNDQLVTVSAKVKEKDRLMFVYPKEESQVEPWDFPLTIDYEDDYLLVIDKPAGLPCIPTRGHYHHTIANALAYYYHINHIESAIHLVNRLDKETSGLMLVAKNRDIHNYFCQDIKQIQRIYHAYVEGEVGEGTIDLPIYKNDKEMKRIVDERGKKAITHYRCIKKESDGCLVECRLETGRTHQIRVHFAAIGHPLIGDTLYGGKAGDFYLESVELSFTHPITHELIDIKKSDSF